MVTFSKVFSRHHYPLFFCSVWSESDLRGLQSWLGNTISHLIILRDSQQDKISVWYDQDEIAKMHRAITHQIHNDPRWFSTVRDSFSQDWNQLLPYLREEKKLTTPTDLKQYYEVWCRWWPAMAILFEIPNVESLPQSIRDDALKLREATQDFSDRGDEVIDLFFAQHHAALRSLWRLMMPEEMFRLDVLTSQEVSIIQQRQHGWGLLDGVLITPEAIPSTLNKRGFQLAHENVAREVHEAAGQAACRGRAQGKVRLIMDSQDIGRLQAGEILVTEMTTPEFVPAMKRSAAIVTDEGGITSHAAIVSRELGKPCIIGTKIATKIFKDGDEVEVDAERGVVRKIES